MSAMRTRRKEHGSVLNVVIYIPSNIGRFESNPRRRLKLRKRQIKDVQVVFRQYSLQLLRT